MYGKFYLYYVKYKINDRASCCKEIKDLYKLDNFETLTNIACMYLM